MTPKASRCAADAHLKQQRFLSFTFYKCFDHIFEIKKKENNAALLTLITDANLKTFFTLHCIISNLEKKNCSIVKKRLFLLKFLVVRFFMSYVKNGT